MNRRPLRAPPDPLSCSLGPPFVRVSAVSADVTIALMHYSPVRETLSGVTPGGVHVRNVAQTVIRQGYAVYEFDPEESGNRRRATAASSRSVT